MAPPTARSGRNRGGGDRRQRLEAELRANLQRRKQQARARSGAAGQAGQTNAEDGGNDQT